VYVICDGATPRIIERDGKRGVLTVDEGHRFAAEHYIAADGGNGAIQRIPKATFTKMCRSLGVGRWDYRFDPYYEKGKERYSFLMEADY